MIEAVHPSGDTPRFSDSALAAVWQLNGYFLRVLAERSRELSWPNSQWAAALGQDLSTRLALVDAELARTPVCLIDIGLQGCKLGERISESTDGDAKAPTLFRPDQAFELARLTLTLVWTFSRLDLGSATIIFGLSRGCAAQISHLEVQAISQLSRGLPVGPRWLGKPRIWSRLLGEPQVAASRLAPTRIRVLQRQFADLSRATSASR